MLLYKRHKKEIIFIFFIFIHFIAYPLQICPKCNYKNNSDSNEYCSNCAASLKKTLICPYCQSENELGSTSCINCGRNINNLNISTNTKYNNNNNNNNNNTVQQKQLTEKHSNELLLKKFQKSYREKKIDQYSLNDLLKLKSMNSTVDVFVKKGTKTSTSIPGGAVIFSIATVDHYKPISIRGAILVILKNKISKHPSIKKKIFSALASPDPLIKAGAANTCCYIDSLKNHAALDSKLIYLLKDKNNFVKQTALSLILRPQSKAIYDPYLFEIVLKIVKNKKLDIQLRKSAIFSLYYILKNYKNCEKSLKNREQAIQSIKKRINDLESKIKNTINDKKQISYHDYKRKMTLDKKLQKNKKFLNDEKQRLKKTSKEVTNLKNITNNFQLFLNKTTQAYKKIIRKSLNKQLKTAATNALEDLKRISNNKL